MTPEREKEIKDGIRGGHPKFSKFRDESKQIIMELLDEIDSLRNELASILEDDNVIYEKFQETQKERDQLKRVLKVEVKTDAVSKFLKRGEEK